MIVDLTVIAEEVIATTEGLVRTREWIEDRKPRMGKTN